MLSVMVLTGAIILVNGYFGAMITLLAGAAARGGHPAHARVTDPADPVARFLADGCSRSFRFRGLIPELLHAMILRSAGR